MPPNIVDPPMQTDPESYVKEVNEKQPPHLVKEDSDGDYKLKVFNSSLNLLAHILIGVNIGISFAFSFKDGLPLGATPIHVVLCVTGYQLLMAQAILSLSPHNGWSLKLRFVDKRRAHWIMQIVGSGLAIAGSIDKVLDKNVHWNTLHGQFALVAMVFTVASLLNGLTSLYASELKRVLPMNLSKLTHICFGVVAFGAATISLCYGYDKPVFRNWATIPLTDWLIAFTAIFTFIIIFNPLITFTFKSLNIFNKE